MADATAAYPSATLATFGGEIVGLPESEWTLATQILAGTAAPFSIVVNEAISARVPTSGWLTLDNEIHHYNAVNAGTKTFTCDARAQQDTVAGQHDVGTWVGFAVTKRWFNQIMAEILAHQAAIGAVTPNLVLNSDGGRRTVFGLAMPESFTDNTAWTLDAGTVLGAVGSNILTAGNTGSWRAKWNGPNTMFRDARISAQVKAVTNTGEVIGASGFYVDASNQLYVRIIANGAAATFEIRKNVATVDTQVATVTFTTTLNNWYWMEIERQGTTIIGKVYAGGAAPATKAASGTPVTITGTVADAGLASGGVFIAAASLTASQWGGIAASPGGVYVETWLPESWTVTHTGTLGGQAIAYDDVADSGPNNKQWTPIAYIPAISRTMTVQFSGPDGGMVAATTYAYSYYEKTSGLGGSGVMIRGSVLEQNSAQATQATNSLDDAAEAVFTRKTGTFTTNAATRRFAFQFLINQGGARTGTVRFSLPQVEQGGNVSSWRSAPEDGGTFTYKLQSSLAFASTSAVYVEPDSRDLGVNIFLPTDCTVEMTAWIHYQYNSGASNRNDFDFLVDGAAFEDGTIGAFAAGINTINVGFAISGRKVARLVAGKHRIALRSKTTGGTLTIASDAYPSLLTVECSRGK